MSDGGNPGGKILIFPGIDIFFQETGCLGGFGQISENFFVRIKNRSNKFEHEVIIRACSRFCSVVIRLHAESLRFLVYFAHNFVMLLKYNLGLSDARSASKLLYIKKSPVGGWGRN